MFSLGSLHYHQQNFKKAAEIFGKILAVGEKKIVDEKLLENATYK